MCFFIYIVYPALLNFYLFGFCLRTFWRYVYLLYSFFFLIESSFSLYLFIYYLWLCWVFVSVQGLSLVAASGGHSSSQCAGLSPSRPLLRSTGSRHAGPVAMAHGPSHSVARGILPDQGPNLCPLH